jgi:lipoprotein-anchoring transpeptidase ErfK/SrfK
VPEVPDSGLPGAATPVPRHVVALVLLVVAVLGFGVGGSLRTAFAATAPAAAPVVRPPAVAPVALPRSAASPSTRPTHATARPSAAPRTTPTPRAGVHAVVRQPASHAVPAGSGTGRRIVYQERTMHLWVVAADGSVVRDYPVTGRPGWPRPGTYQVFSKSPATASPKYGVTFRYMVRFAHGRTLNIGFHDIPRTMGTGRPIQAEEDLGAPVGHGGCVRQRTVDAQWLYGWATIGTTVVVLA